MGRFSNAPRLRCFEKFKRIFWFLKKYPNREVCIDPKIPKCNDEPTQKFDWIDQYPHAKEDVPEDLIEFRGPLVKITCFVDSDHAHDIANRR